MASRKVRIVTPAEVRAAFTSGDLSLKDVKETKGANKGKPANPASIVGGKTKGIVRGRVSPLFVAHFLAANPGTEYAEKTKAPEATVEVPRVSKNGRALKSVTAPVSAVRAASGQAKGRLSKASIAAYAATL